MILENNVRWYAEDGALTKTFCEMAAAEVVEGLDVDKCCACDEAKYSVSLGKSLLFFFIKIRSSNFSSIPTPPADNGGNLVERDPPEGLPVLRLVDPLQRRDRRVPRAQFLFLG